MNTKFSLSILTTLALLVSIQTAIAQTYTPSNRTPVTDGTMNTQVSGNGGNFNISGGVNRGQTLFHSFGDFSIPTNGAANFINPANTRDIITRVTGTNFSDINGLINSNGANFFLVNPNGVTFGTNARLNVGRAFMATSANGINLVDAGGRAITFGTNASGDAPLLSVTPNVLFNVSSLTMGGNSGQINNFGTLQTTNTSQYIGLIGGNVNLNGGKIFAPGGRVDLGGLNGAGTVTATAQGLDLGGNRANVTLSNGAVVSVRANGTLDNVQTFFGNVSAPGGSINIGTNNIDILNAGFKSATEPGAIDAGLERDSGTYASTGGDINLNATGKVTVDNSEIKNTLRPGATGNSGGIKIDANNVEIKNDSFISTIINGNGNGGDIDLKSAGNVNITERSGISSDNISATGNTGNIQIEAAGNINVIGTNDISLLNEQPATALSSISSKTSGKGDTGKIILTAKGDISFSNRSSLSSAILEKGEGNSQGIEIKNARKLTLINQSFISSSNVNGSGNAGKIDIKTTGDINIIGLDPQSPLFTDSLDLVTNGFESDISSNTINAKGDTGKITIDTTGDINLTNNGRISSVISAIEGGSGQGNSQGIEIKNARNLTLLYQSKISTDNIQTSGNAGNIDIKTSGDIKIIGADDRIFQINGISPFISYISTDTSGKGDSGKISIDTTGNITLSKNGVISAGVSFQGRGNSRGIEIKNGRDIYLDNNGRITTINVSGIGNTGKIDIKNIRNLTIASQSEISSNLGRAASGNSGDINIQSTGNIKIVGIDPQSSLLPLTSETISSGITSLTAGTGDAGNISIDTTGDIEIANRGIIFTTLTPSARGNGGKIEINNTGNLKLVNGSSISASNLGGRGDAGNIDINIGGTIDIIGFDPQSQFVRAYPNIINSSTSSNISAASDGDGKAANISISSYRLNLNKGLIFSSGKSVSGGDITLMISDLLLLKNNSFISTFSQSDRPDSNGGNLTIDSPLIVAISPISGIATNAVGGNGGRISITSQGLFGIQFVPKEKQSSFTGNFISSSSTFGRDGEVKIDTPGTDPGRDITELPNTITDASNQIAQTCSATTRENKLILAGRGGLPSNADEPLTTDVVWQDPRTTSTQPVADAPNHQLPPPAVGMVFDGKGKVTLVAAKVQGVQAGQQVNCQQEVRK